MFNTKYLSDYIYLAEATYANFSKGYYEEAVKKAIIDKDKPKQFADLVIQNYEVVTHYADRDKGWKEFTCFLNGESGFSATLFRGKQGGENAGKYVMAFKGTDGLKDLLPELGRFYYSLHHSLSNIHSNFRLFNPKFQGALN